MASEVRRDSVMNPYTIEVTLLNGQSFVLISSFKGSSYFVDFLQKARICNNYLLAEGGVYVNPDTVASFRCYETEAE